MQNPLPGSRVTSEYGNRSGGFHLGLDLGASQGTPVRAAESGTVNWVQAWDGVTKTGNQSYGNVVRIAHDGNKTTLYAHLHTIAVRHGEPVQRGQVIGTVGNTGNSFGAHLHFEVATASPFKRHNPRDFVDFDGKGGGQAMTNSPLIDGTLRSPNHSGRRSQPITKIAIHHTAGVLTGRQIANIFQDRKRQASSNYGIGNDGQIYLIVDEANRAWTTSSEWVDSRAITIEVSNSAGGPDWPVSDSVLARLIDLVTDICRRNGIKKCTYTGDKSGTLIKHEWLAATLCPGPYLGGKFPYIADEVNKRLAGGSASTPSASGSLVAVTVDFLNIRSGPGTGFQAVGAIANRGAYTITETQKADGYTWGRLKSGAGWIALDHTTYMAGAEPAPPAQADPNAPSDWAKEVWGEEVEAGTFDGTRPRDSLTREEAAAVINRIRKKDKG